MLESDRTNREAHWRRLRRDGYLLLRGHLDADLVTNFRRYYFEKLAPTGVLARSAPPILGRDSGEEFDRALMRSILFDGIVPGEVGSHRWVMEDEQKGILRQAEWMTPDLSRLAEERDSRWLLADYRAGDVVVHSSHIVHAATVNVDAERRIRLSTDIRYERVSDPIDWRWQNDWFEGDGL